MEIFWQRTLPISMLECGFVSFLTPGKAVAGKSYVFSAETFDVLDTGFRQACHQEGFYLQQRTLTFSMPDFSGEL